MSSIRIHGSGAHQYYTVDEGQLHNDGTNRSAQGLVFDPYQFMTTYPVLHANPLHLARRHLLDNEVDCLHR